MHCRTISVIRSQPGAESIMDVISDIFRGGLTIALKFRLTFFGSTDSYASLNN